VGRNDFLTITAQDIAFQVSQKQDDVGYFPVMTPYLVMDLNIITISMHNIAFEKFPRFPNKIEKFYPHGIAPHSAKPIYNEIYGQKTEERALQNQLIRRPVAKITYKCHHFPPSTEPCPQGCQGVTH
jgi:alpha-N-acetylglucosamine transferase